MPSVEPFAGVRYEPELPLDKLMAPPYDVIDETERAMLAARHPNNAVHVELPSVDVPGDDPYEHAARLLDQWQRDGVLRVDPEPSLYLYRMTSPDHTNTMGLIGALELAAPGSQEVRPHEHTLPKPLGDRLHLLRATRANLSPIWGLSMARGLTSLLEPEGPPTATGTDDDGVLHTMWRVTDRRRVEAIGASLASAPVVIADGHHRYQTAQRYCEERSRQEPDRPAELIMAFLVELTPEQLHVGPIHRVLRGLPSAAPVLDAFRKRFATVRAGPLDARVVRAIEESANLAVLTGDGAWLLSSRDDRAQRDEPSSPDERPPPGTVSCLDARLVDPVIEELAVPQVDHTHSGEQAAGAVRSGAAVAAVLLRPVDVEVISQWATEGRKMPPKSTYFFPKPRTGMVFRLLDAGVPA